mmetsp:Transcript_14935/g.32205  ORF Transcript_14935/g.32205 Transcript_14935/m.32205 type:complete len:97 (+) Transcript_14935:479-769(+)
MAPVTATSVGIARQTIDDPKLIALLERLSKFDVTTTNDTNKDGVDSTVEDDVGTSDTNMEQNEIVDVVGLVTEMDRVPRWHFQEQVSSLEMDQTIG